MSGPIVVPPPDEERKKVIDAFLKNADHETFENYFLRLSLEIKKKIEITPTYMHYGGFWLFFNDALWIKENLSPKVYPENENVYCVNLYFIRYKKGREIIVKTCSRIIEDYELQFYLVDHRHKEEDIIWWYPI